MAFVVQFIRLRRGVPEVVHTLRVVAADASAAMARAKRLVSTRSWPMRTDGMRVMDDGGRTLIDWMAPTTAAQPTAPSLGAPSRERIGDEPRPPPLQLCEEARENEVTAVSSGFHLAEESWAGFPLRGARASLGHAHRDLHHADAIGPEPP